MKRPALAVLLALLALSGGPLAPSPARAAESFDACTAVVTALPAVLSTPGTWCLDASLASAATGGNAITITANHVTLDCNDFMLDGRAAGTSTTAVGINAVNVSNLTVRRCDVRGFLHGVRLAGDTGGHLVEDNRFVDNRYIAVIVNGAGSIVRRNRVLDTGGTTTHVFAVGIYAAYNVDILDNLVSGVTARAGTSGSAYGIHTESNGAGRVASNRIRGLVRQGSGSSWGVYNANSGRVTLADNDLVSLDKPNTLGLRCHDALGSASGNVINGFATGLVNCRADGGNVVAQ